MSEEIYQKLAQAVIDGEADKFCSREEISQ